ncbi:MAG TPA: family 43 glycosylhydrolase [Tepidisphaeraceae bacterium]
MSATAIAQPTSQASAPPPYTSSPETYSGISGPGGPVIGDGYGGYRSGREGLMFKGPHPKPGWLDLGERATGSAVRSGTLPALRPIWELHLRDTCICLGGDGMYYMTGSSGDNIWDRNDGVELWRSSDLRKWDYLGLVWSIERDGTWEKQWKESRGRSIRAVWAPEIHYLKSKKNYFITLCMASGGTEILKSSSGKPEGPYVSTLNPNQRLTGGIDATIFEDDDGKIYFTWGRGGQIGLMKDDLSGFDGEPKQVTFEKPENHIWTRDEVCNEGVFLFKREGKYYLTGAAFYKDRYSSVAAVADSVFGPYKMWHEAVPCGGGTDYFQDKDGTWFCTYFGNDEQSPWREKPGLVKVEFNDMGAIYVSPTQPDLVMQPSNR